jgi:hypothetical protein
MTTLVDDLVPNQLKAIVEPLLPAPPRPPYGGRHRTISDRGLAASGGVCAGGLRGGVLQPALTGHRE